MREEITKKRDAKAIPHLQQYAPVWIINEEYIPEDQSLRFHAVFRHNLYQWVSRRYLYDGFNDVLYQKGQATLSEDEALEIEEQDPYISPTVADIPNAYGG